MGSTYTLCDIPSFGYTVPSFPKYHVRSVTKNAASMLKPDSPDLDRGPHDFPQDIISASDVDDDAAQNKITMGATICETAGMKRTTY